jgi:hypothetical protein
MGECEWKNYINPETLKLGTFRLSNGVPTWRRGVVVIWGDTA